MTDLSSLYFWAMIVERANTEMAVTLWVAGMRISGTMVSYRRWWQEMEEHSADRISGQPLSETGLADIGIGAGAPDQAEPTLYLVDATLAPMVPVAADLISADEPQVVLPVLLVRTSAVSAWLLGSLPGPTRRSA